MLKFARLIPGALALCLLMAPAAGAAAPKGENGKIAFQRFVSGHFEVHTMNPDGSGAVSLTPGRLAFGGSFSPDGKWIAFETFAGERDINLMGSDGSSPVNLTGPNGLTDSSPRFSPDGKRIVFVRSGLGIDDQIVVMDRDGRNQAAILSSGPTAEFGAPDYSPDGRRIVFSHSSAAGDDIQLVNADGSGEINITPGPGLGGGQPRFSPDGKRVVFRASAPTVDVYAMNADGSGAAPVTQPSAPSIAQQPAFSPDGRLISLTGFAGSNYDVFTIGVDGSGLTNLTVSNTGDDGNSDWEPIYRCAGRRATIVGSDAGETIKGTKGKDVIVGNGGKDKIRGKGGADRICGGDGKDKLYGAGGKDRLLGGKGRDLLSGGSASDVLKGGKGKDTEKQ